MASAELVALTASIREQFGALLGGTVEEMRTGYDAVSAPLASDVTVQSVDAAGVPSEWVSTPNAGKTVVLYLHGGGYVIGSPNSHRELASRIARAAGVAVTVEEYQDAFHVFQAFATQLPEGREAIEKIGGFVRAKAGAGVPA